MPICENAALALIFRLFRQHGYSPFWLPKGEFPIKSLEFAIKTGLVLQHKSRGPNLSLQITQAGGDAIAGYRNYNGERGNNT